MNKEIVVEIDGQWYLDLNGMTLRIRMPRTKEILLLNQMNVEYDYGNVYIGCTRIGIVRALGTVDLDCHAIAHAWNREHYVHET